MSVAIWAASISSGPGLLATAPASPSDPRATTPQRRYDQHYHHAIDQVQEQLRVAAVKAAAGLLGKGHIGQQLSPVESHAAGQPATIGRGHQRRPVIDQMRHRHTVLNPAQKRHVAVMEWLGWLAEPVN